MIDSRDRVRAARDFTVVPLGSSGSLRLHSLGRSVSIAEDHDDAVEPLLGELDGGEREVGELIRLLAPRERDRMHRLIDRLIEVGVLERVQPGEADALSLEERRRLRPQLAFLSHFVSPDGATPDDSWPGNPRSGLEYQLRLTAARVTVIGLGRIGSQLVRALALAGVGTIIGVDAEPVSEADIATDAWFTGDQVGVARATAAAELVKELPGPTEYVVSPEPTTAAELRSLLDSVSVAVVCRDRFRPSEYRAVNCAALEVGTPWTSARLTGFELHMGPTVLPHQTACFECAEVRQKSNLGDLTEYRIVEEFLERGRLHTEALAFTPGASLLALEVVKALTWFAAPVTCSHLYILDLLRMQSRLHPVLKVPRCAACGRSAQSRPTVHAWQQSEGGQEAAT